MQKIKNLFFISLPISPMTKKEGKFKDSWLSFEKKAKAGHSLPIDKLRFEKYPENESAHFLQTDQELLNNASCHNEFENRSKKSSNFTI